MSCVVHGPACLGHLPWRYTYKLPLFRSTTGVHPSVPAEHPTSFVAHAAVARLLLSQRLPSTAVDRPLRPTHAIAGVGRTPTVSLLLDLPYFACFSRAAPTLRLTAPSLSPGASDARLVLPYAYADPTRLARGMLPAGACGPAGDHAGEDNRQRRVPAQPRQTLSIRGPDILHQQGGTYCCALTSTTVGLFTRPFLLLPPPREPG